jgi:hypothetical protein
VVARDGVLRELASASGGDLRSGSLGNPRIKPPRKVRVGSLRTALPNNWRLANNSNDNPVKIQRSRRGRGELLGKAGLRATREPPLRPRECACARAPRQGTRFPLASAAAPVIVAASTCRLPRSGGDVRARAHHSILCLATLGAGYGTLLNAGAEDDAPPTCCTLSTRTCRMHDQLSHAPPRHCRREGELR